MIQCNDLLSLLKKPSKVADFINSLNNEVGDLVSCMGDKDSNGNTILHSIINNAANPKFNNANTSEALDVYFS